MSSPAERYAASRRRQAASSSELARFAQGYDFPLDPFQEEACGAVERGEGVLVAAPTGAGKTVVGEFAVHLGLVRGLKTFYTAPIKALSNQKYLDLAARHGQDRVGLLTGDTSVNPHADVVVMTTEVLRNMLYSGSRDLDRLGFVVMDEVHYLADRFRGPVWEEVIIHLPAEVQVISLSATVSNAEEFGDWLGQVRGRTAVVVSEERPVPLTQHMMVGRRLLPLYSHSADAVEHSDQLDQSEQNEPQRQAVQTGQPPLNPELLKAVKQARRAAASGGGSKNSHRGRGGGSARGTQPWKRSARGGRAPRRGEGGARTARLKPPSRLQVVTALEGARLLPAIVFVFSRAGCEQAVHQVVSAGVDLTTEAEAARIREVIERRTADIPSGDLGVLGFHFWAHALERGVAAHHAGLLPVFKETVEELFSAGLVKVVYATETLALGINMPARTVVLESLRKWNGSAHVTLSPGEYTQLTGRAGRRGIDVEGHAVVLAADDVEPATVSSLASRRTYPLVSAFRPTYNMAVNLLERMPRARVREVLEESFAQFQADRGVVELAAQARRKRRNLEGLEKEMACRLGDFREYAALRQAIADAEADLSRDKAAARRSETGRAMSALGRGDVGGSVQLAFVLFVAVGVAAINHDFVLHARVAQRGNGRAYVFGAVVRAVVAAAQDEVAVFVAVGGDDGGMPQFGDGEEAVNRLRRGDGVNGDLHVAVGAVFEADRAGEAGGELAVYLAFSGARADCAPADEVGDVLRQDHIEVFDCGRYPFFGGIEQQFAPDAQAVVDGKRAVKVRVVEQAFPANGGARFFKVNAHDDAQLFAVFFAQGQEAVGIFVRRFDVVDGAGADDDQEARVVVVQDGVDVAPRLVHGFGGALAHRVALQQGDGRQEFFDAGDPQVIGLVHGGHP